MTPKIAKIMRWWINQSYRDYDKPLIFRIPINQTTRINSSSNRIFLFWWLLKNEPGFNLRRLEKIGVSQKFHGNKKQLPQKGWRLGGKGYPPLHLEDFRKSPTRLLWQRCNGEAFRWGRKKTHGGVTENRNGTVEMPGESGKWRGENDPEKTDKNAFWMVLQRFFVCFVHFFVEVLKRVTKYSPASLLVFASGFFGNPSIEGLCSWIMNQVEYKISCFYQRCVCVCFWTAQVWACPVFPERCGKWHKMSVLLHISI